EISMLATLSGELANTLLSASSTFQPSGRVTVNVPVLCTNGWLDRVKGAAGVELPATSVGTSVAWTLDSVAVGLAGALVAVGLAGAVVAEAFGFCVGRGSGVAVA